MSKPEAERIVTLEVQMTNLEKRMEEGFKGVSKKIDDLSVSIVARNAVIDSRFVDRDDFDNRLKTYEKTIADIQDKLGKSWINNTLSAIFGMILAGLVSSLIYYVTRT